MRQTQFNNITGKKGKEKNHKTKREEDKNEEKQVMQKKTIIPYQLIDAQSVPEKQQLWPTSSHSSFIAEENVMWYGIFLGPLGSAVLAVSPPNLLCPPASLLAGSSEKQNIP